MSEISTKTLNPIVIVGNIITILLPWLLWLIVYLEARFTNFSGLEFLMLAIIPLLYLGFVFALLNISYIVYLILSHGLISKGHRTLLIFGAVLSIFYAIFLIVLHNGNQQNDTSRQLTQAEAINLVKTCQVKSIAHYPNGTITLAATNTAASDLFKSNPYRDAPKSSFDALVNQAHVSENSCGHIAISNL